MKPARPILVIVVLVIVAMNLLRTGARSEDALIGNVAGALVAVAVLAVAYLWWYRRRDRQGS